MAQDIPDRGPTLVYSMIALIVLADISVILRFVSRKIARCGYWYDDYMVVLAMVGDPTYKASGSFSADVDISL